MVALAVALSACLAVPADDVPRHPFADGADGGASAVKDGAPADAAACADAFAVAYASRFDVDPGGGDYPRMLVISALGDGVDLSEMVDGADDSVQLELQLTQPNYDPLPSGKASGELAPDAAELIVGPLVAPDAWTQPATPTFALTFAAIAADAPPPHHAIARLRIGTSVAQLDFDLVYRTDLGQVAVPTKAAMAYSACGG